MAGSLMINHLHWVSMDGFVYFIVFHTWCFCFRFGHFTYYCFRRIRCCCPKHFRCSFWTHLMWSCMSLENRSRRNVSGTQCYTQSLLNVANLSNSDCKPFFNTLGYLSLHLCKHAELSTKILSAQQYRYFHSWGPLCTKNCTEKGQGASYWEYSDFCMANEYFFHFFRKQFLPDEFVWIRTTMYFV